MQKIITAFPDERAKDPSGENLSISVHRMGFAPSAFPAYGESDSGYLTTEPGLFPDLLYALGADGVIQLIPYYWRSLRIEIRVPEQAEAGRRLKSSLRAFPEGPLSGRISRCRYCPFLCQNRRFSTRSGFMQTAWQTTTMCRSSRNRSGI